MADKGREYIVAGISIVNNVEYVDGTKTTRILGGSIFALEGVRCWTDDIIYITNAGPDYLDFFGEYMSDNKIPLEGINTSALTHTHYTTVHYREDGTFYEESIYKDDDFMANLIASHLQSSQVKPFIDGLKGIYIDDHATSPVWDGFFEMRERAGFKVMWEVPTRDTNNPESRDKVFSLLKKVDIYSINRPESFDMFEVDNEQDAIKEIMALGTPCFYRVGAKGSYMVSGGTSSFAPSVLIGEMIDPTGCGNCSTAAAMYAFCEGHDNLMVAIMSNIAAGYNIAQYGPYPKFTDETIAQATALADKMYSELKK